MLKAPAIIQNIFYVCLSQTVILGIGLAKSILLPKFLTVNEFGYWQIYLFYTGFAGIFSLGFTDGIYLRYGTYEYADLPFRELRSAIRIYTGMLLLLAVMITVFISFFITDPPVRIAMLLATANIVIIGEYGLLTFIMQTTNQMKRYSFFSILDKIMFLGCIAGIIVLDYSNAFYIICADLAMKSIVVLLMLICCCHLFIGIGCIFSDAYKEFCFNIIVGIKLLLANSMGILILGIGRILIQWRCPLEAFAYYSFGISITSLILFLITAISLVLYPTLKRLPKENFAFYFDKINTIIIVYNLFSLFLYGPIYWSIQHFFIKYISICPYLNLLFIIVILQNKMNLLNNTFYKVLRKEGTMLWANLNCLVLFAVVTVPIFFFDNDVWWVALGTALAMLVRVYSSEYYLRKQLGIPQIPWFEIINLLIFLVATTYFSLKLSYLLLVISALANFAFLVWHSRNPSDFLRLIIPRYMK